MNINKFTTASYGYILIALYIFLGTLYSVDILKPLTFLAFFLALVLNTLFIFRKFIISANSIKNPVIFLVFFSSFFFMLISAFYNNSIELLMGVLNFIFYFLFFALSSLKKKIYQVFELPIKALFFSLTPINFIADFSIPFQGVFSNPNSLGGLYATISIISLGIFYDKFKDTHRTDWILISIIFLSCIFSLISNSRISFAISFFSLFLLIFLRFSGVFKYNNDSLYIDISKTLKIATVLSVLVAFIILNFNYILDIFIYKTMYKFENDNFSAGRATIWKIIIDNGLPWGHGRDSLHLESIGLAAHNTFMSMFDQFGYISAILFLFGCIALSMYYSLPKIIKLYGILPLCISLGFLVMSISESMINKTIMFSLLAVINLNSYIYLEKK